MLGSSPRMTAGKMAPPKCPPHPPGPDDILSDLAATHQEAPQGGKITRPQVILFPMVSEFARKFQKNHHSRSNLRNCALHKMSRTSKNQEKRSEEHTSELQSLMRISYAVFCLKKTKK